MKNNIPEKDSELWWDCENEICKQKLGKIISSYKDFHPQVVEITGLNGQKFVTRFHYIEIFCHKCGTQNTLFGGMSGKEFERDWNQWNEDGHKEYSEFDNDFLLYKLNPVKKKLLLNSLSNKQKDIFDYFIKYYNDEEENNITNLKNKLGISLETYVKQRNLIFKKMSDAHRAQRTSQLQKERELYRINKDS